MSCLTLNPDLAQSIAHHQPIPQKPRPSKQHTKTQITHLVPTNLHLLETEKAKTSHSLDEVARVSPTKKPRARQRSTVES